MRTLLRRRSECFFPSRQSQRLVQDQEKLIDSLQQDLARLQKRLRRIESEGIVEPSVMFTRLDAERNERALKHAVEKGRVPEGTYTVSRASRRHDRATRAFQELTDVMKDYVGLPTQQLGNLVQRYTQFRRAGQIESRRVHGVVRELTMFFFSSDRIRSGNCDSETKDLLQRMGSLYGRVSTSLSFRLVRDGVVSAFRSHRRTNVADSTASCSISPTID